LPPDGGAVASDRLALRAHALLRNGMRVLECDRRERRARFLWAGAARRVAF
jgi:hypothetical protein